MKSKKLIAAALAASIGVAAVPTPSYAVIVHPPAPVFGNGGATVPWAIFACAGGIIASAMVANFRDNRELTAPEAWTCGVLFWFAQPKRHKH